jgi:glucose-1-phosphate cytidylyltransferase
VSTAAGGIVREICPLTQSEIWINGGFFAARKEIFSHIRSGEELVREPFQRLIQQQALLAYKYTGFWHCMDTFKDKQRLDDLDQGTAPWKVWDHAASPISKHSGVVKAGS